MQCVHVSAANAGWRAAVARPAPCRGDRVLALTWQYCRTGIAAVWHLKGGRVEKKMHAKWQRPSLPASTARSSGSM